MAEENYTRPNMMTTVRYTQGEREESIVEIYASIESLKDQHQDYVGAEESSNTLGTGRSQQPDAVSPPRCLIRAVVLLVLLSIALLAGLLWLAVKYKTDLDINRDVEQCLQRLKNVTEQKDSLLPKKDCPGDWGEFGGKCYLFSQVQGSWNTSREFCVSHGADLVVVDSKEEMDFISRYSYFWLGATDEASEGTWRWVDGTVLSADNPYWRRGKPDGGKDKNCLRRVRNQTNLKWTDESCEVRNWVLCELKLIK